MGFTALPKMWSSLIALASATGLFLRSHLCTRAGNIASSECAFVCLPIQVVKVHVHEVYDVPPQGQIEYRVIKVSDLPSEAAG